MRSGRIRRADPPTSDPAHFAAPHPIVVLAVHFRRIAPSGRSRAIASNILFVGGSSIPPVMFTGTR